MKRNNLSFFVLKALGVIGLCLWHFANVNIQAQTTPKPCFDFYGTGRTSFATVNVEGDVIVWRIRNNGGSGQLDIGYGRVSSTLTSDFIVPGYYDNDNRADIAVWRNDGTSGTYYIRRSTSPSTNDIFPAQFGLGGNPDPTDSPGLEADYDGDGRDDLTVVRDNGSNYVWYILSSSNNTLRAITFGNSLTDIPMAGANYVGGPAAELVVLRGGNSTNYYIGDATNGALLLVQQWGNYNTDFYVVGDFLGDSRADFAVWRGFGSGTDGRWYIRENGGSGVVIAQFGIPGAASVRDFPVCGDYNGDGKSDIAVYRRSNKTFYWAPNPSTPATFQAYTMTFPAGTGTVSGEIPIGAYRTF